MKNKINSSYAVAYTRFLNYCSFKLGESISDLVVEFKDNGLQNEFHTLYEKDNSLTSDIYYKILIINKNLIMEKESRDVINVKVAIMIDHLIEMLHCDYSTAYAIIENSKTYHYLKDLDYATLYDSPQANLSEIGKELRTIGDPLGFKITDDNIKNTVLVMRKKNLIKQGIVEDSLTRDIEI